MTDRPRERPSLDPGGRHDTEAAAHRAIPVWRATLSGALASLVGIGLARFAFTPLLPAIVSAGWFSRADTNYLAAANLAGYLLGVLLAGPTARRSSTRTTLRATMLLTSLSLLACAWRANFAWFLAWRLVSGLGGGVVMILAAPTVLTRVAPGRRGLVSGVIFMGIGLGVAASGALVPHLLREGLTQTWIALGLICLLLTLVAWNGWPAPATAEGPGPVAADARSPVLRAVQLEYGLNAVGLVPHMVFLAAFVARGLGQGVEAGARYWVAFGLGATVGPLLNGHLADRIGFRPALQMAFVVQALATLVPAVSHGAPVLVASSLVMGAFTPGVVPLALGRVRELAGGSSEGQAAAWRGATTAFSGAQASAAYAMAFLLNRTGDNYGLLFELGAAAMVLALVIDLIAGRRTARASP